MFTDLRANLRSGSSSLEPWIASFTAAKHSLSAALRWPSGQVLHTLERGSQCLRASRAQRNEEEEEAGSSAAKAAGALRSGTASTVRHEMMESSIAVTAGGAGAARQRRASSAQASCLLRQPVRGGNTRTGDLDTVRTTTTANGQHTTRMQRIATSHSIRKRAGRSERDGPRSRSRRL